jgi:aminoglycoside phosphotransferase family enzyme
MLPQLIAAHQVTPQDIDSLVDLFGSFYRTAPAAPLSESDYRARFQCALASNREVLLRPQFKLRNAALAIDRLGAALALGAGLLRDRVSRHRILDGHGDLRPEHVCLLQPPVVFDCLEFNSLLRQRDPFDEISFLGMECGMAGAPWIGPQLVAGLAHALNDPPHAALMHFYTAHCALLRARLAMAHLLDPEPRLPQKWPPQAERYIARALSETDAFICAMRHGRPE